MTTSDPTQDKNLKRGFRVNRPSQYLILALPSESGSLTVLQPDFEMEVKLRISEGDLPKWLAQISAQMESELTQKLLTLPTPHKRPIGHPRLLKPIQSKALTPHILANSLGISEKTVRRHKLKTKNREEALKLAPPISHLDYPLVIGPLDGLRKVFFPDLEVSCSIDRYLNPSTAIKNAIETLLIYASKAFKTYGGNPPYPSQLIKKGKWVPSPVASQVTSISSAVSQPEMIHASDFAHLLGVSPKTILRKYREFGTLTPGGHLRWSQDLALKILSESLELKERGTP